MNEPFILTTSHRSSILQAFKGMDTEYLKILRSWMNDFYDMNMEPKDKVARKESYIELVNKLVEERKSKALEVIKKLREGHIKPEPQDDMNTKLYKLIMFTNTLPNASEDDLEAMVNAEIKNPDLMVLVKNEINKRLKLGQVIGSKTLDLLDRIEHGYLSDTFVELDTFKEEINSYVKGSRYPYGIEKVTQLQDINWRTTRNDFTAIQHGTDPHSLSAATRNKSYATWSTLSDEDFIKRLDGLNNFQI